MRTSSENSSQSATEALKAAILKLESFVKPTASSFEVQDGKLFASKEENIFRRVKNLARYFVAPLFSEKAQNEVKEKLNLIKEEVLRARDILQSHLPLIKRLEKGDQSQQKLAGSAIEMIKRYNAVVENDYSSWTTRYNFYNFERNQILLDTEIKQKIELPITISRNFESHTPCAQIQKSFQDLSQTFLKKIVKSHPLSKSTLKKSTPFLFMADVFRLKATRMVQAHFKHPQSVAVILELIKQAPIETVLEEGEHFLMRQVVEEAPGFKVILTGSFKQLITDSRIVHLPILENFHLAFHVVHTGFPYPSQHLGWGLSEMLTDAFPLRSEQVPKFHHMTQQRKQLAHQLLHHHPYTLKSQSLYKLKKEVFNQNRELFLNYHKILQTHLLNAAGENLQTAMPILSEFYAQLFQAASPYDEVSSIQQKINQIAVENPAQNLEEEWLKVKGSALRKGSSAEKLQVAKDLLDKTVKDSLAKLNPQDAIDRYLYLFIKILSPEFNAITLQYFSEKIGFAPPVLSDCQQKLQLSAFSQLFSFLQEFEEKFDLNQIEIEKRLSKAFLEEIKIFEVESIEEMDTLPSQIVQELEVYFPARYFASCPRKSYIPKEI